MKTMDQQDGPLFKEQSFDGQRRLEHAILQVCQPSMG